MESHDAEFAAAGGYGTAPAPTTCPRCEGEGIVPAPDDVSEFWFMCPECRCAACGEPTDTPPLCARCQVAEDDLAGQMWREGRYE